MSDRVAAVLVKVLRTGFDIVSGYKHKPIPPGSNMSLEELRKGGYVMDETQWLYVSIGASLLLCLR
jgi:ubiquinol oxidase